MGSSGDNHASVKLYWQLAAILSVITFVEWAIFRVDSLRANGSFMIPALLILSLAKFVMVCGWYMHLRYDPPLLSRVFIFSMALALLVFVILVLCL